MKTTSYRYWTSSFALLGGAGTLLSGCLSMLPDEIRYAESWAIALEVIAWGIWPVKIFGMGLGDISTGVWISLIAMNITLFGLIGTAIGLMSHHHHLLLIAHIVLGACVGAWCLWLGGFQLSASQVAATFIVTAFYALPLLIVSSIKSKGKEPKGSE